MIPDPMPIELEPVPETHASDCEAWEYGMCSCGRRQYAAPSDTEEADA